MAIYRHVRDKDELLVLLLDRLADRLPRPALPDDPRARLACLWRILYDGLDEHPRVVEVLVKGHLMARSVLWLMDEIVAAFVTAGLTHPQAAFAYRTAWQFTVGALTIRHGLARTAAGGRQPWDYDAGLAAVLDGLMPRPPAGGA
jgi:AcrR family transcriptional regulator